MDTTHPLSLTLAQVQIVERGLTLVMERLSHSSTVAAAAGLGCEDLEAWHKDVEHLVELLLARAEEASPKEGLDTAEADDPEQAKAQAKAHATALEGVRVPLQLGARSVAHIRVGMEVCARNDEHLAKNVKGHVAARVVSHLRARVKAAREFLELPGGPPAADTQHLLIALGFESMPDEPEPATQAAAPEHSISALDTLVK